MEFGMWDPDYTYLPFELESKGFEVHGRKFLDKPQD
jgi:hypothetical protein